MKLSFTADLDENRLKLAKSLGADFVFKVGGCDAKTFAKEIKESFGTADRTIECTGAESSIHTAIYVRMIPQLCLHAGYLNAVCIKQLKAWKLDSSFNSMGPFSCLLHIIRMQILRY